MKITMVKKQLKDGSPCRKCSQAEQLLKDRNLWQHIGRVIWAVDDDPTSEGFQLAERHRATQAPFFLIERPSGDQECVQSTLQLLRVLSPTTTDERDASKEASGLVPDKDDPKAWILLALGRYGTQCPIAFSGAEDVVLIDMAANTGLPFSVFCLDTGRLHPETYDLLERVRERYAIDVDVLPPDTLAVQELVRKKGLFSFYRDGHAECCAARKVGPLRRFLSQQQAWITGQRKDQSPDTRASVALMHADPGFKGLNGAPLMKFNPLANWSSSRVWSYIHAHNVPFNSLHRQGYVSIGCQPCTRAVLPGQHEREGRWWWELPTQKECGLHSSAQLNTAATPTPRS